MTARLIHLNGPPGVGKSTLAARWTAEHPGTLNCDIDVLRTLVGGWREDFSGTGELIRPVALAMISAYLAGGHDVVMPQLIARAQEQERFEHAALSVGARLVLVFVDAPDESLRVRWRRRTGQDAWAAASVAVVEAHGGDEVVDRFAGQIRERARARPEAPVLMAPEGEIDATYDALVRLLG
ncbi:AAA family ATPase [Nocardioides sp. InS609-2]|uniref:AAA family ATPase n=1 Tax=Nocardioides sp. InS609-2 TaxID=2760705 RepID=UPI0020C0932F|nr:AAA family ATPase [Nocardioides sp. InS609-2]